MSHAGNITRKLVAEEAVGRRWAADGSTHRAHGSRPPGEVGATYHDFSPQIPTISMNDDEDLTVRSSYP